MASPHPAEAPVAINPHQNARYTLKLSERITNPSQDQSRFRTVKFNHKPAQAAGNARTTTMKPASSGDDQFTLCIRDKEKEGSANSTAYEYAGERKELKKTYVLVFDKDTQTATLEPLDETYAFNLRSAPWENDPAKLAEEYSLVRPRNEKPDRDAAANDDADDLFSDGSATPRSTAESMFGGGSFSDEDEPDESNPFDFRHFLKDAEQSEGFASPYSHSGTPLRTTTNATTAPTTATATSATARSTPVPQHAERPKTKPAPRAAPKQATAKQTAAASSRKRKSPEPEQPAAKPKPTSPTTTKTKQQPTPSIRLDRRASTRPTDVTVAAAADALSASAPAAARSQQSSASSTKSSSRTSREPSADEDDDDGADDDDQFGGLEIDWGGSGAGGGKSGSSRHGGRQGRRSIALAFEQSVTGDGPVSLRSAADSASPNSRLHTPNMRATTAITSKNAPDVIDFGGEGGGSGDEEEEEDEDAGGHHHHRREADRERDEEEEEEEDDDDDDDGYAEDDEDADGDVDPLTLGSPAADTLQQSREDGGYQEAGDEQQQQQQHQLMVEGDDDDDDGAGDFEDDFEAEMAQALASAAEEGEEDGGRVMHEESEESEEE